MSRKKNSSVDLVIRGVRIPGAGSRPCDIAVRDGRIVGGANAWLGPAFLELDGEGDLLLPGWIDTHVHLNEPGRADWEGITTGTRALAAGGATAFCDMPLNSSPPCLSRADVEVKRRLMKKKSLIDFGIWGGLVPGNVPAIGEMARSGVVGIKAFLCPSGLDEFPASDEQTLLAGAHACAREGLILGVHAEDPGVLAEAAVLAQSGRGDEVARFLVSRPPLAEERAIDLCLRVARETGCRFHIVHVTTASGLKAVRRAATRGTRVTAETCPHYLLLDPGLMRSRGAVGKCAPPLRSRDARAALWRAVMEGRVDTIGSDHSPAPPRLKNSGPFAARWGGIGGAQHGALLFLAAARRRRIAWPRIRALLSANPARIFGFRGKGGLAPGADADFVLLRHSGPRKIVSEELLTRHPLSPYTGLSIDWAVRMTLVRGRVVYRAGFCAKSGQAREVVVHPSL